MEAMHALGRKKQIVIEKWVANMKPLVRVEASLSPARLRPRPGIVKQRST